MLAIENLCVSIGGSRILRDVTLELPDSKVFCLMGRNGVGKTTTLKTVVGLPNNQRQDPFPDGKDISRLPASPARAGIGYVPQGRGIFPHLTVEENLVVGAVAQERNPSALSNAFAFFPILISHAQRRHASGGQQQQLAIGRALLTEPKVLILDEPTERYQLNIIDQIKAIKLLRRGGHHNEAMLSRSGHLLKKLTEQENHQARIAGSSERADQGAAREGAHRDSNAFRQIDDTFAALRNEDRMKELCSRTRSPRRSACSTPRLP